MAGGLSPRPGSRVASFGLRRLALAALVLVVLAVHGCVTQSLGERLAGLGAAAPLPARLQVAYVRELNLAPAVVAAAAAPAVPVAARAPAARPAPAASAPQPAASQALPTVQEVLEVSEVPEVPQVALAPAVPELPPEAEPVGSTDADLQAKAQTEAQTQADAALETVIEPPRSGPEAAPPPPLAAVAPPASGATGATGAAPPFDWPVSTRVSYRLTGNVRGEVHGDAQVEWVRAGNRYQVHLDVTVGLSFAPLMTRRMSSDGDITPEGLSPRRYDQDTQIGFGTRQRAVVRFEPETVVLATGQRRERSPGMQDTASQFIQLAYLFGTRPELLQPGGMLEVPLALPRSTSRWIYDVVAEVPVYTPFGSLQAYHLKPRRGVAKGNDLSAEIWFAPQLRYLPVRIRIQQDAETFVDLVIARKPELAAP